MKTIFLFIICILIFKTTNSKIWCETNETCSTNISTSYHCNLEQNICEHNSLLEFHKSYLIGAILIIFISAFANAGGIGGGSVIVPVLTIIFAFEVKEAIPLSKATIFAGAVVNVLFLINKRNLKNPNKSLIDYKLCSFMLPIMMCGTFFGVYLNFIFPPMVIIVFLTGYLIVSIVSLKKKYQIISKKEDEELGITLKAQILETYKIYKENIENKFNSVFKKNEIANDDEIPEMTVNNMTTPFPNNFEEKKNSQMHTTDMSNLERSNKKLDQTIITTISPKNKKKKIKTFSEMICDNLVFILILFLSIFIIVILSLFKEGILMDLGTVKISRCSALGLSVLGIILIFCLTISIIAFNFNLKKEEQDLSESIVTGENIPLEVQNDLNELKLQQELSERELSEIERHQNDYSGDTDYLSFHEQSVANVFSEEDNQTHKNIKEFQLSVLKQEKAKSIKSRRFDDIKSIRSELSIKSIIDDNMQQKKKTLIKLGFMSFFAGSGAGFLGIGGGMVKIPNKGSIITAKIKIPKIIPSKIDCR